MNNFIDILNNLRKLIEISNKYGARLDCRTITCYLNSLEEAYKNDILKKDLTEYRYVIHGGNLVKNHDDERKRSLMKYIYNARTDCERLYQKNYLDDADYKMIMRSFDELEAEYMLYP